MCERETHTQKIEILSIVGNFNGLKITGWKCGFQRKPVHQNSYIVRHKIVRKRYVNSVQTFSRTLKTLLHSNQWQLFVYNSIKWFKVIWHTRSMLKSDINIENDANPIQTYPKYYGRLMLRWCAWKPTDSIYSMENTEKWISNGRCIVAQTKLAIVFNTFCTTFFLRGPRIDIT